MECVDYKEQDLTSRRKITIFETVTLQIRSVANWYKCMQNLLRGTSASRSHAAILLLLSDRTGRCRPPRGPHESISHCGEKSIEHCSNTNVDCIGPFTETSHVTARRPISAPKDQDAQAFYEIARKARVSYPDKLRLCYMYFHLGHNDVTSGALGGCGRPDRGVGAVVVAMSRICWSSR
jgi:hypothetical protein